MARMALVLLAALLLAGCAGDDQSAAERKVMNAKFGHLDYEMSNVQLSAPPFQTKLERLTQRYIALLHEYEDDLGDDEVKKRLEDKAFELSPYCLPCVGTLDRERERY